MTLRKCEPSHSQWLFRPRAELRGCQWKIRTRLETGARLKLSCRKTLALAILGELSALEIIQREPWARRACFDLSMHG